MRKVMPFALLISLILVLSILPTLVSGQATGVTAEAIGQANMRARPDVNAELVGEIFSGTRYPVIGKSEQFPWLLLGDVASLRPIGWIFQDLLNVYGDTNAVPFSSVDVSQPFIPSATPPPDGVPVESVTQPAATATPNYSVSGTVSGEINVRYGPGVEYDRLFVAQIGQRFEVTAYHTQLPWVQIRYAESPNGFAWIARDLLTFEGNPDLLPAISQTSFNLPTLTPTSAPIRTIVPPNGETVPLSSSFQALGNRLWEVVFSAGFDPQTSRLGALYIQDLRTGEAIAFGEDIAFSGTSINKIAILIELFNIVDGIPDILLATDIANTMICSENATTNRLLSFIGNGDALYGADLTTQLLRDLGLQNTFIAAPYDTTNGVLTPTPVPRALNIPASTADQSRANPDPVNEMTVDEMGYLLSTVYQCAVNGTGALMDTGNFTPNECQRIIQVMSNNNVDALLRAGVPENIPVAHKHGWIPDTHGNAAIMFTPGGDYVITMMLYQETWLNYSESLPTIAEVSRTAYNFYNPDAPLDIIRDGFIPEANTCNFEGSQLVNQMISPVINLPFLPTAQPTATPPPVIEPSATPSPSPSPVITATFAG
ncbi:MAG: serine hydrolase [Aggregatilineales bacterium]